MHELNDFVPFSGTLGGIAPWPPSGSAYDALRFVLKALLLHIEHRGALPTWSAPSWIGDALIS